jgi:hypothetical protein
MFNVAGHGAWMMKKTVNNDDDDVLIDRSAEILMM